MKVPTEIQCVVIGASWGGLAAISQILRCLGAEFNIPIVVVIHQYKNVKSEMWKLLDEISHLEVREVEEKLAIERGYVYLSAPNYHLLIENDRTFSLSVCPAVNFCRPSIDVLFETAADVFGEKLVAIILTGANEDGAKGSAYVKSKGGMVIIQDPQEAEMPVMPNAAIATTPVDMIANLEDITAFLNNMSLGAL